MPITSKTKFVRIGDSVVVAEEPRLLTQDEIDYIIRDLPQPLAATQESRDLALKQEKDFLRQTLANYPVSPNAIELVKQEIQKQYELAQVLPGKPVGIRCAEAFIATVMQATLNTRHKAGSGVDVGFDAVREVIFMPNRRKTELVFLHFKDRKTRNEILDFRSEIVYRNVWHFVDEYIIDTKEHFPDEWWHPFQRRLFNLEDNPKLPIIRLYFNVPMLAEYKTSMREIAEAITRGNNAERVKCLFGPTSKGIMDIYPTDEALNGIEVIEMCDGKHDEYRYIYFLDQNIKPALMSPLTLVRGHEDVDALYYTYTPVISGLAFSKRMDERGSNGEYLFFTKKKRDAFLFQGLRDDEVAELLQEFGGVIVHAELDHFIISLPESTGGKTPTQMFEETFERQSMALADKNEGESRISILNKHNYAILHSSNLSKPLSLPGVDRSRTYCNNFHEMTRVIGTEAARSYHLYNTYQVMTATKTSINPRYFEFFTNVVFHRGYPMGITFTGISKQTGGWLTRAAIEQSGKIITEAALYDRRGESTRNISVANTVGNFAYVGTGVSKYGVDFEQVDPSLILDIPEDEEEDFDPNQIVKEVGELLRDTTDVVFDQAEGDENVLDQNVFNKSYRTPDLLNIRKTIVQKGVPGTPLRRIQRIINNRDFVAPDEKQTPSYVTPDTIQNLPNYRMFEIPPFVKQLLGLEAPTRIIRNTKTDWPEKKMIVEPINVESFLSFFGALNSHSLV